MLNWAIAGTSFISTTIADRIAASAGSQCMHVFGRNPARTAVFASRYGCAATTDFDMILNDPAVDIVYVGLPNDVHYAFCERALHHGKAVLCEKSLTTRWDDAQLLFAAAQRSGRLFMEGFAYFHHPLIASLQTVLREGRAGKLKYVQASYSADIVKFANPAGGGSIFNLGCYPVSLLQLVIQTVFGPEVFTRGEITGAGFNADGGPITEASLTIRYEQGLLASIHSSDTFGLRSDLSIHGEIGTIVFKTNPWLPEAGINRMELQHHDGRVEVIDVESELDGFGHQIRNAEDSFKANRAVPLSPARSIHDSLEIMQVLTSWHQACERGSKP
ncbi:Glucose-fructose oxidoreductase precursor [Agrobacterium sp. DSM 25558]|uniref:Gfo/Idh/MocA family protein n=1 Tax=Agrobacterium sp. DSM 25558 TaxID=1907665 RepID=UPI0009726419|nr:Gfo/Idh/MocA family oxidoreductase [Agrobacterium sp. DSM 25558]SCX30122.1 Glucose-fructose oxidoreductase precursor [Agrobacterium sp. DSM 25558]